MADLTYDPPQPQDTDSELKLDHKTAVNISRIADGIGSPSDDASANTVIGLLKQLIEAQPGKPKP